MVAARYERLSASDGDKSGGGGGAATGNHHGNSATSEDEEIELDLNQHKIGPNNGGSQQHRTQRQSNFKYSVSKADSGTGGADGGDTTLAHHQENMMMQMAVGTLAIILLYLTLSISLTFYQTDINRKMPFPLAIVTYHLVLKFLLAAMVRRIYKLRVGRSRVQLDWRVALRKMAPTGVASAIDIGFSNWGLALVPISLYTMTKSSTIVFILLFAIALGLEKKVSGFWEERKINRYSFNLIFNFVVIINVPIHLYQFSNI